MKNMRVLYHNQSIHALPVEEDLEKVNLRKTLEELRNRLEVAYCRFDNVTEPELIDSYIYEINSLQEQYNFLTKEAETKLSLPSESSLYSKSPIRTLIGQVLGQHSTSVG